MKGEGDQEGKFEASIDNLTKQVANVIRTCYRA